ncbi:TetR/AcrR family transcriptional regulator [Pseudonocardia sp. KRD291]|uniref:TetR/AcrR family transcriptional regulator n=1 Tax=Pseudonocardia sp. KRD291 TaxID=2792007 RepID=UPI001C49FE8B|nr:TetR family transcriptional regulator [Pseudonocardia sp. KRD291]MBW0106437.1 TetR family transcriptional regulator [Pseudonocardia sp. KRD291]
MTGDASPVDGRRARGERRRELLLDAALAVIARDGAGQVTHRAVAAEAGVSPASPGHHFTSVDDILVAALTRAGQRYVDAVDEVLAAVRGGADLAPALARAVAGWEVLPGNALVVAEYELYLMAARRPELAPVALGWADRLAEVIGEYVPDPVRVQAVVAFVEGTLLQALLGRTTTVPDVRATLERLLTG